MTVLNWQARLDLADTEGDVLEAAREYLSRLSYFEIVRLPDLCRPRKLVDASDIAAYALDLVRHHCDEKDESAELVHRMAAFFAHANVRLSQILQRTNDPDATVEQSA